ncbi:MAG: hypothetical protein MUE30_05725 [Spirosomaceae bacterium]|jgi:hypothetical protein|nr:hypothetical protein [Spirosomataceae bacterium]
MSSVVEGLSNLANKIVTVSGVQRLYAKGDDTVFFSENIQPITKISLKGEYNPHDLNQYGAGDFLGVTTGKIVTANGKKLLQFELTYDHQFKVLTLSRWRPRTAILWVFEEQVTTDAPPTEEEKKEIADETKKKEQKELVAALTGSNSPEPENGKNPTKNNTTIIALIAVGGSILVGLLIWLITGRKKQNVEEIVTKIET